MLALILACLLFAGLFGCNEDQENIYREYQSGASAVYGKSTDEVTRDLPIVSSNGGKLFQISDFGPMAMLKNTPHAKQAWAFLKFQIGETDYSNAIVGGESGDFYRSGLPVNRKNALQLLENAFGEGHEQEIGEIMDWCAQLDSPHMMMGNTALIFVLQEISREYYNGLISAEDCAAKIQERVVTYLKE